MTVTRNGERAQNILLVSCYELGHQPLHVASAAAFLREAGHEVKAVDLAVESLDERAVMWADLVAIAVPMHTAMRLAAVVARRVRELRDRSVTVVTFGLYAPLCRSVIEGGLVDHAVGGEFEEELVRIAAGTPSSRTVVLDRLSFPVPARDLLPSLERYARLLVDGDQRLTGYVEATRGCVHKCRHCPVPAVYDGRIRVVQRQTMVEDVAQLHALGARHLTFGDPDFLNAVPHALAAARAVHERFPEMTFDVTTKIEHILEHRSVLAELRELGLIFVVTAAESTSARVLEILDKGHTRQQILEAVAVLRSHGIEPRPSWLPFTPWSGLEEYLDLLDLILDADLVDSTDPVQLTIRLLVPEGSLLLARPDMREHIVGHDPATFTYQWRHPEPIMDELQARLAAAVGDATDRGEAPRLTHARIRELAGDAARLAGLTWDPRSTLVAQRSSNEGRPRLSEAWFCCAEPTERQLAPLASSP